MNLKQLTLDQLKGLILRLWPGLAGFHVVRYAVVKKVYEESGKDAPINPLMAVDLQFCKHDFSLDIKHKVKKKVRLAGGSEFVQAPPTEGTYVLIHFPYWLCNTATVLSVLYLDRQVNPEKDCYQIRDANKTKISAKSELSLGEGEDQAVLGNELVTKLENLIDKVSALGDEVINLGNGGTVSGGALNAAAAVATSIGLIKSDLAIVKGMLSEDILSEIKLGRGVMSQLEGIWAVDIKWDPVTLGPVLNDAGDDFVYVYNEDAVAQVIHLAIRDSEYTPRMINVHPSVVNRLLNDLVDELETNEWSIALGTIKLSMDFKTSQLIFTGTTEGQDPQSIRVALDMTIEGT